MVICDFLLLIEIIYFSFDVLGKVYVEKCFDIEGLISQVIGIGDVFSEVFGEFDGGMLLVCESYDKDIDVEVIYYYYDLFNDFYQFWLDLEMVYFCVYFEIGKEDFVIV